MKCQPACGCSDPVRHGGQVRRPFRVPTVTCVTNPARQRRRTVTLTQRGIAPDPRDSRRELAPDGDLIQSARSHCFFGDGAGATPPAFASECSPFIKRKPRDAALSSVEKTPLAVFRRKPDETGDYGGNKASGILKNNGNFWKNDMGRPATAIMPRARMLK